MPSPSPVVNGRPELPAPVSAEPVPVPLAFYLRFVDTPDVNGVAVPSKVVEVKIGHPRPSLVAARPGRRRRRPGLPGSRTLPPAKG